LPKEKTKARAKNKKAPAPDVQKQPEAPEKKGGPLPAARTAEQLEATGSSPGGSAGRAQMATDLQGSVGNTRVSRIVEQGGGESEGEADRVADSVMRAPESQFQNGANASAPAQAPSIQRLRSHQQVQRQTVEEADLSVLRGALLFNIQRAHAITSDRAARQRLSQLENRIPSMTADQLRAAISTVQRQARAALRGLSSGNMALTPSATPSTLDWLQDDPDQVVQESRNHQLHQLLQVLSNSTSFGGRNIRRLLGEMNMTLNDIRWFANSNVGFGAATAFNGVSGTPPRPQFDLILGPSVLVMMNRPDEDMVPTLYHEIYHVYEQFRQVARGGRRARPNLSQREMRRRAGLLSGTAVSGDTRFATEATGFARMVESELFAELIEHSALQDPSQTGPRTVMTGQGIITTNNPRDSEAEVAEGLRQLRLIFGDTEGRRIAMALLRRANREPTIHATTRRMFRTWVEQIFPAP
jgi:hypothetical protein